MLNNLLAGLTLLLTQRQQCNLGLPTMIKEIIQIGSIVTNTWVYMFTNIVVNYSANQGGVTITIHVAGPRTKLSHWITPFGGKL